MASFVYVPVGLLVKKSISTVGLWLFMSTICKSQIKPVPPVTRTAFNILLIPPILSPLA